MLNEIIKSFINGSTSRRVVSRLQRKEKGQFVVLFLRFYCILYIDLPVIDHLWDQSGIGLYTANILLT